MIGFHLPWLELAILVPLIGGIWLSRSRRDPEEARLWCLAFAGVTFVCGIGAWIDFAVSEYNTSSDALLILRRLLPRDCLVVDELSAPLFALTAMLHMLVAVGTLRTKSRRYSFAWSLVSEAIVLATLACKEPWGVIGLLAAGTVPPWLELKARHRSTRVYVTHMALFVVLMVVGWGFAEFEGRPRLHSLAATLPLLGAIFVRCGMVPVHCWMTDLFEKATFGTALLFVTPMMGAYAAVRLVLPIAPDWVLRSIGLVSLVTAVYAAGMSLVQREGRRFFCYLLLSHSALVLVGLEIATTVGLTGALCVWLSVGVALTGFGLTLRALESRSGRISLVDYHGMYEHAPTLAVCFLLTGLASVGFPGTFGFVGSELLVDGAVQLYPLVGVAVLIAAAMNGISVVRAYFLLFTGTRHVSSVALNIRGRELAAVLVLAAIILGGGLFPQWTVQSRHHAAEMLVRQRQAQDLSEPSDMEATVWKDR